MTEQYKTTVLLVLVVFLWLIVYLVIRWLQKTKTSRANKLYDGYVHLKSANMQLRKENRKVKEAFELTVLRHTELVSILRNDPSISKELRSRLEGLV